MLVCLFSTDPKFWKTWGLFLFVCLFVLFLIVCLVFFFFIFNFAFFNKIVNIKLLKFIVCVPKVYCVGTEGVFAQ